jgi:hypothetical protein
VKTALYIAYGEAVPAQNAPQDDEEWRKLITTAVSQAWPVLFVDNVGRKLDSSALSAYATAVRWQDRILGKNEGGVWPCHALVVCTGNNPDTSGEIARRIVPIRIEADCERPEERSGFRYPNLLEHVAQNRLEYLSCALELISLWVKAGKARTTRSSSVRLFRGMACCCWRDTRVCRSSRLLGQPARSKGAVGGRNKPVERVRAEVVRGVWQPDT